MNNRAWERTIVLPVHCKDKIEVTKVWGFNRSWYWGHLNPPLLRSWSHPRVCLVTLNSQNISSVNGITKLSECIMSKVNAGYHLMISNGTSRVYVKLGVKPTLAYEVPEHSLCCRTPANVPCTHSLHQVKLWRETNTYVSISQTSSHCNTQSEITDKVVRWDYPLLNKHLSMCKKQCMIIRIVESRLWALHCKCMGTGIEHLNSYSSCSDTSSDQRLLNNHYTQGVSTTMIEPSHLKLSITKQGIETKVW